MGVHRRKRAADRQAASLPSPRSTVARRKGRADRSANQFYSYRDEISGCIAGIVTKLDAVQRISRPTSGPAGQPTPNGQRWKMRVYHKNNSMNCRRRIARAKVPNSMVEMREFAMQ